MLAAACLQIPRYIAVINQKNELQRQLEYSSWGNVISLGNSSSQICHFAARKEKGMVFTLTLDRGVEDV